MLPFVFAVSFMPFFGALSCYFSVSLNLVVVPTDQFCDTVPFTSQALKYDKIVSVSSSTRLKKMRNFILHLNQILCTFYV